MLGPIGHIDFYPHGGILQAGCFLEPACSHSRAWEYFIESINGAVPFYGRKCWGQGSAILDWCYGESAQMGGIKYSVQKKGFFSLATRETSPFAK